MNDLDAAADDVTGEARLLRNRREAAKGRDRVFGQRNIALRELGDERPPPPQAGELDVEPRAIEHAAERHELVLRAAAHQRRHHVEDARGGHAGSAEGPTLRSAPTSIRRARAISARHVFLSATASPAMLKK